MSSEEKSDYMATASSQDSRKQCRKKELSKKEQQKRRPKPKDGATLSCGVCGDKSLGYNFDAVTCESCKAFFRRNALKRKVFTCNFDNNCTLDSHTRKFCSGCRLKKCFDIGMKKDWILGDDQLAKRRERQQSRRLSKTESESSRCVSPNSSNEITTNFTSSDDLSSPSNSVSPEVKSERDDSENLVTPLDEEISDEIKNLELTYHQIFNAAYNESQAARLKNDVKNANELFNMTDGFIRRLIKFSKCIPEFRSLSQEDQISLLKGGIMEVMFLRSAMGFQADHSWKFSTKQEEEKKISMSVVHSSLGSDMYNSHIKFVTSLHQITRSNQTILLLLFVIELFSDDRPNISNKTLVAQAQEKFSMWLRKYLESIYPKQEASSLYPKLLIKLLDVRNLGETSTKMACSLDAAQLQPLLVEVFNLSSDLENSVS